MVEGVGFEPMKGPNPLRYSAVPLFHLDTLPIWLAGRDSNPRPSPYQKDALTILSYPPIFSFVLILALLFGALVGHNKKW